MNNGQEEEIYQLKQRVRQLESEIKVVQNACKMLEASTNQRTSFEEKVLKAAYSPNGIADLVSALEKAQEEARHWNSVATKLLNPL